ncbi:30S ribosomal protein S5 [Candidatus Peregrinibacteria bacterium]|jgi:small subunit ribosomal protein S5|nr:30S ribosomal protein S5 [Candidatus Peregrinibacteria bacterium]MBT7337146.1 30S ribosomal protein S5 [Candidatus Peregrinibacteria bacterium]
MTAKTARPDRKKGNRRQKAPSEFEETTLTIDRVTRVVAGGRRMRFRAVVVVGDKKGRVGVGTGKSAEVQGAVQKATAVAKRNMIRVPIVDGTIPHEIDHKFKASRIRLLPARDGTGIIAGGALRTVLEHAGVQNVLSKRYGTNNKLVNAQCVIKALQTFRVEVGPLNPDTVKKVEAEAEELPENINITEVSKKDVSRDGNLQKKK